jgi:hypothetical protein
MIDNVRAIKVIPFKDSDGIIKAGQWTEQE